MGKLEHGEWSATRTWESDDRGHFQRQRSSFRDWIRADGSTPYTPEAGRYHLYVSYACPWAHRALIGRALYGLEEALPVTVVDPRMGDDGWRFEPDPEPVLGARTLREVYLAAEPRYTGRVTVPALWDRRTGSIVNNESREILRMLSREWRALHTRAADLAPEALIPEIDATIDAIYEPINNGVYRCGFARTQAAYDEAVAALFGALDRWDAVLADRAFLLGDRLTEADVCLYTTLLRFDLVYYTHFKCNLRHVWDYPNLWRYARQLWSIPEIRESVDPAHIKVHYYWSHEAINPRRIVPAGPARWLGSP